MAGPKIYDSTGYLSAFPLTSNSPQYLIADGGTDVVIIKYGQVEKTIYDIAYADGYNLGFTGSTSPSATYSTNSQPFSASIFNDTMMAMQHTEPHMTLVAQQAMPPVIVLVSAKSTTVNM